MGTMDPATTYLIITQSITFVLLVISETLGVSGGPYAGIIHFILGLFNPTLVPPLAPTQPVIAAVS